MDAEEVTADATWTEPGFVAWLRAFFGRPPRVLHGEIVATRTGLTVNADGVHGALLRWPWSEIENLQLEEGVSTYLIVDLPDRPRRRRFAVTDAAAVERMRELATANGWSPSAGVRSNEAPREQRMAANTARFIHRFPDAFVIRVVVTTDGATRAAMAVGMTLGSSTRYGHLVVDEWGLRWYMSANETDWEKPWREVMKLELTSDQRAITMDAVGWQIPKHFAPCEPNGDVLLPFAVKGVLAQLRARRPATGVR